MARTVHPKPMRGSSSRTMLGNTRPPVALPDAVMPMASDRRFWNQVARTARLGQNRKPFPSPTQRPWARKNCQYCVQAEVEKVPSSDRTAPMVTETRAKPASVRRPVKAPMKKRRKIWKDPIQEMSWGGRERRVV